MGTDHRLPSPSNTLRSRCSWSSGACCFCSRRCWRRVGHGGWCSRWARCCCWVSCWTRSASVCCWCWGTRRRSCCSGRLGSGQRCWKCKEGFMCWRKVIKWYFCEKYFFLKSRVDLYTKMYKIKLWEIEINNIDHHELS